MIRILHVLDKLGVGGSSIHGVSRAITWWIPRFDPAKFQFAVCSLRAPEPAVDVYTDAGIDVTFLSRSKFDPLTIFDLLTLMNQKQADILHLHGYGATTFGRIASTIKRIPNIVHEHVVIEDQPFYQTMADALLSPMTTCAIAISEPVRKFMVERRKIKARQLETFFYGIPLAEFQVPDHERLPDKRAELGICDDECVICAVGRLDTQKGQVYLLRAAPQILAQFPRTRFLIVGDGPDLPLLQQFVDQQGMSHQVIFTGYRTDIPDLLAISDVIAIPSLWEGGPLTLFEAMNLAKPVVGTPVGMIPEIVQNGETGFVVPCRSHEQLADRIILLLKDPALRQSIGTKSQQICQNFDISASVKRLEQIYQDLV